MPNAKPFRPEFKKYNERCLNPALWGAGECAVRKTQQGQLNCGVSLRLLAEHIRDLCGSRIERFRKNCDEHSRHLLATAHRAVYEPRRRKRLTDEALRDRLLERAKELENLSRTFEARDANIPLEAFCFCVRDAILHIAQPGVMAAD